VAVTEGVAGTEGVTITGEVEGTGVAGIGFATGDVGVTD
jgi:hypothetical protein